MAWCFVSKFFLSAAQRQLVYIRISTRKRRMAMDHYERIHMFCPECESFDIEWHAHSFCDNCGLSNTYENTCKICGYVWMDREPTCAGCNEATRFENNGSY